MSGSFAELFEFLNADRILGVLGIVVGFGGALLAWIFYQVGVATKSMSYDHSVATLLSPGGGSLPAEVAVFFGNEQIRNLRSASVRFWNSGSTTINGDDLVSRSGLSIKLREEISDHQQHDELDELRILDTKLSSVVGQGNDIVIRSDPASIDCFFEFLDPGQGFAIDILYTGPFIQSVEISAIIKGIPSGLTKYSPAIYMWGSYPPQLTVPLMWLLIGASLYQFWNGPKVMEFWLKTSLTRIAQCLPNMVGLACRTLPNEKNEATSRSTSAPPLIGERIDGSWTPRGLLFRINSKSLRSEQPHC